MSSEIIQSKNTTGPPDHVAPERTFCWNSVDNELYINSGGDSWTKALIGDHDHTHDELADVTADQHHAEAHAHSAHTGIGADDHHAQSHLSRHQEGGADVLPLKVVPCIVSLANQAVTTSQGIWEVYLEASVTAGRVFIPIRIFSQITATAASNIKAKWKFTRADNTSWESGEGEATVGATEYGTSGLFSDITASMWGVHSWAASPPLGGILEADINEETLNDDGNRQTFSPLKKIELYLQKSTDISNPTVTAQIIWLELYI